MGVIACGRGYDLADKRRRRSWQHDLEWFQIVREIEMAARTTMQGDIEGRPFFL